VNLVATVLCSLQLVTALGPPDKANLGDGCGGAQPLYRQIFAALAVCSWFAVARALAKATQAIKAPRYFSL